MKFTKIAISLAMITFASAHILAQTSAFNFQGRLNDGTSPANGRYDLQFKLFDAITGGNQVGTTLDQPNKVLVNGVFSTTLDFGSSAFTGGNRFIEISVRPNGSPNPHVILGVRQQIMSVPFAVRSANATQADNATNAQNAVNATNAINAQNAVNATNAINATTATNAVTAQNSLSLGGVPATTYARLNETNTGELVTTGNIRQSVNSNGAVKMMALVNANATIGRCYNGILNGTNPPCNFTVSRTGSYYRVDFGNWSGFEAANRFISVAPYQSGQLFVGSNIFTDSSFPTVVFVGIFDPGNPSTTNPNPPTASFQIIVY